MRFNTLYKLHANWDHGRQPKNHLSNEEDFVAFCGRKQVENMGGIIKYNNGKWFTGGEGLGTVEISEEMIRRNTCSYCFAHAFLKINGFESKLK